MKICITYITLRNNNLKIVKQKTYVQLSLKIANDFLRHKLRKPI
jgi:hypothetical protein